MDTTDPELEASIANGSFEAFSPLSSSQQVGGGPSNTDGTEDGTTDSNSSPPVYTNGMSTTDNTELSPVCTNADGTADYTELLPVSDSTELPPSVHKCWQAGRYCRAPPGHTTTELPPVLTYARSTRAADWPPPPKKKKICDCSSDLTIEHIHIDLTCDWKPISFSVFCLTVILATAF